MAPQDFFIEEDEEVWFVQSRFGGLPTVPAGEQYLDADIVRSPLCIEEFDLSDRNFRPCPCGYQVCQFCFNNIKNNMNGLCPACRRPYDEKTIQWKVVTPEEVAEFRANIQKNQKKRAQEQRQKEVQKREAEKENRKNLIGVRVVQKNLVYVTGWAPVRENELLKILRKPEYFGQYGNIQKISISNRKSSDGQHQSLGIYVTFEKPEEATRCIQAVHGSQNMDRILKAQLGTTKYCSAWLKNEKCSNPGCMFLHEQGDEEDSYTRQDLSSMNSIHTQRPLASGISHSTRPSARHTPPPQARPPSQSMARSSSKEGSDNGVDVSELPSLASWARNTIRSRRSSHATDVNPSSPPLITSSAVNTDPPSSTETPANAAANAQGIGKIVKSKHSDESRARWNSYDPEFKEMMRTLGRTKLTPPNFKWRDALRPPMFDPQGGAKRRAMRRESELRARPHEDQSNIFYGVENKADAIGSSIALSGSLEHREGLNGSRQFGERANSRSAAHSNNAEGGLGQAFNLSSAKVPPFAAPARALTPQQLLSMRPHGGFSDPNPPGITNSAFWNFTAHSRPPSRSHFTTDNTNSAANLKENARYAAPESSLPAGAFQSPGGTSFFSNIPGPPPGLKSVGTPPSILGYSFGSVGGLGTAVKDSTHEMYQSLVGRNRSTASGQHLDLNKRELLPFLTSSQSPSPSAPDPVSPPGPFAPVNENHRRASRDLLFKQRKKGKKQRHANTSSGGSGLVNLADPGILQTRMQQQLQGNVSTGAMINGQNQDEACNRLTYLSEDESPSFDKATTSAEALVSDEIKHSFRRTQVMSDHDSQYSVPPGFVSISAYRKRWPGSLPVPGSTHSQSPVAQASGSIDPQETSRSKSILSSNTTNHEGSQSSKSSGMDSKKLEALETARPSIQNRHFAAVEEDFPALDAPKARGKNETAPMLRTIPLSKGVVDSKRPATSMKGPSKKSNEKSQFHSGSVASICSQTQINNANDRESSIDTQFARETAMALQNFSSPSRAKSPLQFNRKASYKSLRVLPLNRGAEITTQPFHGSSVVAKPSSSSQNPETPFSEGISDSASLVSGSVSASRAGSPPLSRIESVASRNTTKSQQRKQRREIVKQETQVLANNVEAPFEEHAPVVGRKKKQRKDKPMKKAASGLKSSKYDLDSNQVEQSVLQQKHNGMVSGVLKQGPNNNTLSQNTGSQHLTGKGKGKAVLEEERALPQSSTRSPSPEVASSKQLQGAEKPVAWPASILAMIRNDLWTDDLERLYILRPVGNSFLRQETGNNNYKSSSVSHKSSFCKDCACKCGEINDEDFNALRSGKAVRKQFHVDGSRMLITPNGDCIRGLTVEEEDAFITLQAAIAASAEDASTFVAPRHQPGNGAFSLIKGRAVPNGRPNIFPTASQVQFQDPIGKLQREDALSYINQYVLPRLNLNTSSSGLPYATPPMRGSAATSLNSLAPYFYGPDAAAGVGIYGAPEGLRAVQNITSAVGSGPEEASKMFATGGVGNMPLMSIEDAEAALAVSRKETEKLEKGLNAMIKRNRKQIFGGGR